MYFDFTALNEHLALPLIRKMIEVDNRKRPKICKIVKKIEKLQKDSLSTFAIHFSSACFVQNFLSPGDATKICSQFTSPAYPLKSHGPSILVK
jgi:hypothetical protein